MHQIVIKPHTNRCADEGHMGDGGVVMNGGVCGSVGFICPCINLVYTCRVKSKVAECERGRGLAGEQVACPRFVRSEFVIDPPFDGHILDGIRTVVMDGGHYGLVLKADECVVYDDGADACIGNGTYFILRYCFMGGE